MYTHAKRSPTHVNDPAVHVRVQWTMEKKKEKKATKKKACTKSVRAFRVLTLHTTRKKKQKNESKKLHQEQADTMAATPLHTTARKEPVLFEFLHPVNQDGYVRAISARKTEPKEIHTANITGSITCFG